MSSILKVDTIQNTSGVSEVKIDAIKDTGGNTIISSNGTGTFTSNLPSGGDNTPSFQAYMNGNQTLSNTTYTKMEMDTEVYDSDSKYDTSNYRFTRGTAGKYWVWGKFRMDTGTSIAASIIAVYKNGSLISKFTQKQANSTTRAFGQVITLDADDYIELYGYQNGGSSENVNGGSNEDQDTGHWGAWKINGVT